jgi:hypothetical protein
MRLAAGYQLATMVVETCTPLLLRALILAISLQDEKRARTVAIQIAAIIAATQVLGAVARQRQLHLATQAGRRARALAISQIYEAAVVADNVDDAATKAGEVLLRCLNPEPTELCLGGPAL